MNWEAEINIYTLLCVKQTANENLPQSTGISALGGDRGWMHACSQFTFVHSRNLHNTAKAATLQF